MGIRNKQIIKWDYNTEKVLTEYECIHDSPRFNVIITLSKDHNNDTIVHVKAHYYVNENSHDSWAEFHYDVGIRYGTKVIDNDVIDNPSKICEHWSFDRTKYLSAKIDIETDIKLGEKNQVFYVEPICQGCYADSHGGSADGCETFDKSVGEDAKTYLFEIELSHICIETPPSPEIKNTSGTTITVSCNSSDKHKGQVSDNNGSNWYDSPHIFTGYGKGTSHTFKARAYCGDDCPEGDKYKYSTNSTEAKTWNISLNKDTQTTKTLSFKANHTPGTNGSNETQITYELYSDKDYSNKISAKTGSNNTVVKFDNLNPNTTYYCKAYSNGVNDNNNKADNTATLSVSTLQSFTIDNSKQVAECSATTIKVSPVWNNNGSTEVNCNVTINSKEKKFTSSGSSKAFINLISGTNYSIKFDFSDKEGNNKSITLNKSTKKVYIEDIDKTTRIIQFICRSNTSTDEIETCVDSEQWKSDVEQNSIVQYNKLTHDTDHLVKARIKNCFAFNEDNGEATNINDSEITETVKTEKLILSLSTSETHQHSLVISAQGFAGAVPRDYDRLDESCKYKFVACKVKAVRTEGYYNHLITNDKIVSDGEVHLDYQKDKKIYINNLTYYYCNYNISVIFTDGFNSVTHDINSFTTFPYMRIYLDGKWHKVMPYIYRNNEWKLAPILINNGTSFVECDGEN